MPASNKKLFLYHAFHMHHFDQMIACNFRQFETVSWINKFICIYYKVNWKLHIAYQSNKNEQKLKQLYAFHRTIIHFPFTKIALSLFADKFIFCNSTTVCAIIPVYTFPRKWHTTTLDKRRERESDDKKQERKTHKKKKNSTNENMYTQEHYM